MPIDFDDSKWPYLVCLASGESSDADMDTYIQVLADKLARRERHVLIVDAREGQLLRGTHRKRVAHWNSENAEQLTRYRAGLVLVTPSIMLRGMVTAIYWLHPAPFPYKAVGTMEEGEKWADRQLAAASSHSVSSPAP